MPQYILNAAVSYFLSAMPGYLTHLISNFSNQRSLTHYCAFLSLSALTLTLTLTPRCTTSVCLLRHSSIHSKKHSLDTFLWTKLYVRDWGYSISLYIIASGDFTLSWRRQVHKYAVKMHYGKIYDRVMWRVL